MSERMPSYISALSDQILDYIEFKASIGMKSHTRNYVLRDFDRWCATNGVTSFDKDAVEGWVCHRLERTENNNTAWISVIRDMGRYLQLIGRSEAYVISDRYRSKTKRAVPYLLSEDDIDAFFGAISLVRWSGPWRYQVGCVFGLMHSCGLRPGEVRNLKRKDVHANELEIDIVKTKNNNSRRLPVTQELMELITSCDESLNTHVGEDRPYLFVNGAGRKLEVHHVTHAFKLIWQRSGLPECQHGRVATPYALRHHFAYANLERWARDGLDADAMLPYLSRYMGHSSVEKTYYYVHVSPDFLSGYSEAVSALDALLPEVGFDD